MWFSREPRSIRLEAGALELAIERLRPSTPIAEDARETSREPAGVTASVSSVR